MAVAGWVHSVILTCLLSCGWSVLQPGGQNRPGHKMMRRMKQMNESDLDAEPWPVKRIFERSVRAGQSNLQVEMPKTFTTALEAIWKPYVWQVHAGEDNMKGIFSAESQFSNVMCPIVRIGKVTLLSKGFLGESTHVSANIDTSCKGDYCWQAFGWTSRGSFRSRAAGNLQLVFPPMLPPLGESGPLEGPGVNGGWCNPADDFVSEIFYETRGPQENAKATVDLSIWKDEVCRAIRRKVVFDDDDAEAFDMQPFVCGPPIGPLLLGLFFFVVEFAACWKVYKKNVAEFHKWQEAYDLTDRYCREGGKPPLAADVDFSLQSLTVRSEFRRNMREQKALEGLIANPGSSIDKPVDGQEKSADAKGAVASSSGTQGAAASSSGTPASSSKAPAS
eukprot:TRINITY_DN9006_c0_g3_i1.p1 TRINITY_DN9006_c0_g3~~TRINITY_DN9006_c0_g3_i1.p1  ORF type:complete len:391 (+),score=51.46 TRINITY_DN9006_c0_g3_i1:136-1308(+)